MMISKKINTDKLKVKHVLGIQSTLDSYPDPEDILYELIHDYCSRKIKKIKFTDISLQKKYSLSDEQLKTVIKYFKKHEFLTVINETSSYTTYEIVKNPYE